MVLVIDYNLKELKIRAFKKKQGEGPALLYIKNFEEVKDHGSLRRCILEIAGRDKIKAIAFRVIFGGGGLLASGSGGGGGGLSANTLRSTIPW